MTDYRKDSSKNQSSGDENGCPDDGKACICIWSRYGARYRAIVRVIISFLTGGRVVVFCLRTRRTSFLSAFFFCFSCNTQSDIVCRPKRRIYLCPQAASTREPRRERKTRLNQFQNSCNFLLGKLYQEAAPKVSVFQRQFN